MQEDFDKNWSIMAEEVLSGMKEWRLQHPKATFGEIEKAVDARLDRLRARMIGDAALASAARDLTRNPVEERPVCAKCQTTLVSKGRRHRELRTKGDVRIDLKRNYALCPKCGTGLFPPR